MGRCRLTHPRTTSFSPLSPASAVSTASAVSPSSAVSHLQKAAEDGPVIIVDVSNYSCDASIITSAQDPVHIPLSTARAKVSELSFEFQPLAKGFGSSDHKLEPYKTASIIRKLWNDVVGPVVQALEELVHPASRIWWCLTAEFSTCGRTLREDEQKFVSLVHILLRNQSREQVEKYSYDPNSSV